MRSVAESRAAVPAGFAAAFFGAALRFGAAVLAAVLVFAVGFLPAGALVVVLALSVFPGAERAIRSGSS